MSTIDPRKSLSAEQAARWHWLLRAIDVAETQSLVARAKCRADGYLLGLRDARVINEAEREALDQEATAREVAAAHRTAPQA
ncbi:hypothetical protein [Pseudomonas sp. 2FE]|uniref:hypothetical protein n=1 Tax=Pseudomonas sp. 2FE TaxID=2502190 RepID=UPI0010F9B4FC|nr:hypothetical protein [Pseudomonas sp. 2FE]